MSSRKRTPRLTPLWLPYIRDRLAAWETSQGMTVTPGGGDTAVGRMLAQAWDAGDSLRTCPVWWVSRDMTTLATDTAQAGDLPDVDPPSDKGFIVFQDGIPCPPLDCFPDGLTCTVDAVKWTILRSTGDTGGKPWRIGTEVFTREQAFIDRCDPRLPLAYVPLPDGVRLDLLADILTAVWALSDQPSISESRPPRVTPLDRVPARYAREEIPRVKMLILRENLHRPGGQDEPDEKGREYTHRWIVRGFWREQPYGKDHAKRRRQWIPPFVKGPADKPLIRKETVRIWRR